jgi:hypothetical protein
MNLYEHRGQMSSLQFFESRGETGPKLPLRSTLVTLSQGHRILISPVKFNENQVNELKKSSPKAVVAPNLFHHLYAKQAAENLNVDTVFVAPGLEKKRPDIPWPVVLGDKTWIYQDELPMLLIEGMPGMNECVFFHKESKTLIVTDLLFNLSNLSGISALPFKILGTCNRPAVSRLLHAVTRDKKALKKSLQKILSWDFDRLVMAHGSIIESGAKKILTEALSERGLI